MTTEKKTSATKSADIKSSVHEAAETASENLENIAQTAINRAKEAIPSLEDVTAAASTAASDATAYLQDNANLDLQGMADDATQFVRRNPGTSLAAAAGLGILIGILATKRS
ncbi:MAG: hypothetical protein ACSHW1_18055 [Yoonia sp.]|uniref:hypothetical protein n=1 Tax=Yoonia sp. TaxID=2212373 RepID=UPI003EFB2610